jgi:hypothetical protein
MTIITNLAERRVNRFVEQLFQKSPLVYGRNCVNPVTGGSYIGGDDPVEPQKEMARRALLAGLWFADHGPPDGQPLPISGAQIERLKFRDPLSHIISCFAYSLRALDWDVKQHPPFEDFARGVLASEHAPEFVVEDRALRLRYPPRRLPGLGPYMVWAPPEQHARTMEAYRRDRARAA